MIRTPAFSQRLLRKGPLVEETYRLFADWRFSETPAQNLNRCFHGRFPTSSWEREVMLTTTRRLQTFEAARPLILLAQRSLRFDDWRDCYRLWVGTAEEPFRSFVLDWLYPEFESGRHALKAENAREFAVAAWSKHSPKRALSDHGVTRMARDLFKAAADLGMLSGAGVTRTFSSLPMSEAATLFYAHLIAEIEGSPIKVPASPLWRFAYMAPADVHAALLHLHQFRRVDYQIAGSLIQLTLPQPSATAFAESFAA